ncbi:histidine phosphatase family protein [Kribbella solani]|uniref:Putative phosphoglycerate mutase n=1 Tax=Kribbella solani TaxID=236067 RepID=A0A841DTS1_9ACTN|nr:histidine phosphatase family protein [Kribbella solani]MBB5980285.1 putative phosphoglycerate mutase [Kribbella solani]MDX2973209.1 histidine phosphatase family protein [Kribbella solani]
MTELLLLRHGESLWNAEHRYQGQQGTGLSARGRQQAKDAADYLRTYAIDAVVASDLQRVTETLQPYLDSRDHVDVRIDRRWREIDVGSWGGRTFTDVYAEEPDVVDAFARGEDIARGGGETFSQLRARVWEAARDITDFKCVLVVTHGGPIRVAAASALRLSAGGEMALDPPCNCSLTVLHLDGLTSYNVPTGTDR